MRRHWTTKLSALLMALALLLSAMALAEDVAQIGFSDAGEGVAVLGSVDLRDLSALDGGKEDGASLVLNGVPERGGEPPADNTSAVSIDKAHFPANAFRNYVSEHFDKNGDGKLSASELKAVKAIELRSDDDFWDDEGEVNCPTLKGVEYFANLESLICPGCGVSKLDVSKNTKLKKLICTGNSLKKLDVSKNTKLRILECNQNRLTALDVSKCTALERLHCWANRIAKLNVTRNRKLKELRCNGNAIKALDVSKNKRLTALNCGSNQIKALKLTNNKALKLLNCSRNRLKSLDVSRNKKLQYLYTYGNSIKTIDLKNCATLRRYLKNEPWTDEGMVGWVVKAGDGLDGIIIDQSTSLTNGKKVLYEGK